MPNQDRTFEAWAPPESRWSAFVKPVLFAHVSALRGGSVPLPRAPDVTRVLPEPPVMYRDSAGRSGTAIIVDRPGLESVALGVAFAHARFRPVPLFNALPGERALVDVWPIVAALAQVAEEIGAIRMSENAPPAFLLDANRRRGSPRAGSFDNRSVCFATDFPSGAALVAAGVRRVVVVHEGTLAYDLVAVISEWSKNGIEALETTLARPPRAIRIGMSSVFARMAAWYDRVSYIRHERGEFGHRVRASTS